MYVSNKLFEDIKKSKIKISKLSKINLNEKLLLFSYFSEFSFNKYRYVKKNINNIFLKKKVDVVEINISW
jgi:hypothetical protein